LQFVRFSYQIFNIHRDPRQLLRYPRPLGSHPFGVSVERAREFARHGWDAVPGGGTGQRVRAAPDEHGHALACVVADVDAPAGVAPALGVVIVVGSVAAGVGRDHAHPK
jgi:hypothetical protein